MPPLGARADGNEQARGGTAPFVAECNGAEKGAGPRRASELCLQNSAFVRLGLAGYLSPPRVGRGATSCPADHAPELAEGRGRTGASGGRAGERLIFFYLI